jgi:CRP/FNR family cyclic AMP-dependent transcriptional regulator
MSAIQSNQDRILRLRKGDILFRENEDTQDFYVIKSGSIKILKKNGTKEIVLDTLGPGMVAGEIASIDMVKRSASGVATSDTEVIIIPRETVGKILETVPDWFRKIAYILVSRLREVDEKISRALTADCSGFVAALIAMVAYSEKARPEGGGYVIDRKFLEYEIMDLLTIPLSEVQDAMERLAGKGILKLQNDSVVVQNRDACEQLASGAQ